MWAISAIFFSILALAEASPLTGREYAARMAMYSNGTHGCWMREFDFLVDNNAFLLGETYYIVAPDDDAARCAVLGTLWQREWRASLVRLRVTRFSSCYDMICTVQATDEASERRQNYRAVFHHGHSYPTPRRGDCMPTGWRADMYVQLPCSDWPCDTTQLHIPVIKIAL